MHQRTPRSECHSLTRHGASKRTESTPAVVRNMFGLPGVTDSLPKQVEPPWSSHHAVHRKEASKIDVKALGVGATMSRTVRETFGAWRSVWP